MIRIFSICLILFLSACKTTKNKNVNIEDVPFNMEQNLGAFEQNSLKNFEENLQNTILFDFDSNELSGNAKKILDTYVSRLSVNPNFNSNIIEGHCDQVVTRENNLALGERRAEQVKRYLVSCGISADRLITVSFGKEKPVRLGNTAEDDKENRRTVFLPGKRWIKEGGPLFLSDPLKKRSL